MLDTTRRLYSWEKHKADTPKEKIVLDRLRNKRPDGFAIKIPAETKEGELVILEFKRMSCVTDQYVKRAKHIAETQYVSIKSALQRTLGPETRNLHRFLVSGIQW
jgi:hypothetical protein